MFGLKLPVVIFSFLQSTALCHLDSQAALYLWWKSKFKSQVWQKLQFNLSSGGDKWAWSCEAGGLTSGNDAARNGHVAPPGQVLRWHIDGALALLGGEDMSSPCWSKLTAGRRRDRPEAGGCLWCWGFEIPQSRIFGSGEIWCHHGQW